MVWKSAGMQRTRVFMEMTTLMDLLKMVKLVIGLCWKKAIKAGEIAMQNPAIRAFLCVWGPAWKLYGSTDGEGRVIGS